MNAAASSSLKRTAPIPPEADMTSTMKSSTSSSAPPAAAPRRNYDRQQPQQMQKNQLQRDDATSTADREDPASAAGTMQKSNGNPVIMTNGANNRKSSQDDTLMMNVILPNNETCPFHVNKRMPLMDLLVHAASTHHFNPSDYAVYNPNAKFPSLMTPSTPVGELSTTVVQIVPKNSPLMNTLGKPNKLLSAKPRGGEEPFEKTFRLQINLPHKQMMVLRVGPKQTLQDVLNDICHEKNLNTADYTLRNPRNLDHPLAMYRQLAEERINEINLVPVFQDTIARHSKRFAQMSDDMTVDPSGVRQYEKKRSPLDIFKLCRKKRMTTNQLNEINLPPAGASIKSSRPMSKSTTSLADFHSSSHNEPAKLSKKRDAPKPPPAHHDLTIGAASNGQSQMMASSITADTQPPRERTRHHSESSGYDESLVLSNSPERDGCSVDNDVDGRGGGSGHFTTPSPVNVHEHSHTDGLSKQVAGGVVKVPLSVRSSTSTPDSGLKSASETVSKTGTQISKKKAPAPPPPASVKDIVGVKDSATEPVFEGRSRTGSEMSAVSASNQSLAGSTMVENNPRISETSERSSDTVSIIGNQNLRPEDQVSMGDDQASFTYEGGSVTAHEFDEESTDGSVDIHNELHPNLTAGESHAEVRSLPNGDSIPDWGYKLPHSNVTVRRSYTLSSSSEDSSCMETTVVMVNRETVSIPVKSPSLTEAKMTFSPEEHMIQTEGQTMIRRESTSPPEDPALSGTSTPDSGIQSQRATLKDPRTETERSLPSPQLLRAPTVAPLEQPKLDSPQPNETSSNLPSSSTTKMEIAVSSKPADQLREVPAVAVPLRIEIPVQMTRSTEPPSPSPSITSIPPPLPDSTPPPVQVKTMVFPPRKSPAQISISSFNDQKPSRYREIVSHQPPPQYEQIVQSDQVSELTATAILKRNDSILKQTESETVPYSAVQKFHTVPPFGKEGSVPSGGKGMAQRRSSFFNRSLSRDELLSEIKTVQQTIAELNAQMLSVQLHATITPEELAAITDKQRILQEHVQRQIALTQQLLAQDEANSTDKVPQDFKRSVSPPPVSKTIRKSSPASTSSLVPNPAVGTHKLVGGVPYSEVIALPKKMPIVTKMSGDGTSMVYATVMAEEAEKKAASKGAPALADIVMQTRPKMQHRNSWLVEASKRFDFSGRDSTTPSIPSQSASPTQETGEPIASGTRINITTGANSNHSDLAPTFSFSTRRRGSASIDPTVSVDAKSEAVPMKPTPSPMGIMNYSRNFSTGLQRNPSQTSVVGSLKASTSNSRSSSQNSANRYSLHEGSFNSLRDKMEKEGPSFSNGPVRGVHMAANENGSGALKDRNEGDSSSVRNVDYTEDPIDSIVRSWKSGTPTPYHHVNPTRVSSSLKRDPVGTEGPVGGGKDENKVPTSTGVPIPPPPPPKMPEMGRSFSVPVRKTESVPTVAKPQQQQDIKSELMDEIKNFSVNSLRKVPASNQKTWTPKIR